MYVDNYLEHKLIKTGMFHVLLASDGHHFAANCIIFRGYKWLNNFNRAGNLVK